MCNLNVESFSIISLIKKRDFLIKENTKSAVSILSRFKKKSLLRIAIEKNTEFDPLEIIDECIKEVGADTNSCLSNQEMNQIYRYVARYHNRGTPIDVDKRIGRLVGKRSFLFHSYHNLYYDSGLCVKIFIGTRTIKPIAAKFHVMNVDLHLDLDFLWTAGLSYFPKIHNILINHMTDKDFILAVAKEEQQNIKSKVSFIDSILERQKIHK